MIRRVYSYSSSSSSSTGKEKKGIKLTHYKHRCRHKPRATFKEGEKRVGGPPFHSWTLNCRSSKKRIWIGTPFFLHPLVIRVFLWQMRKNTEVQWMESFSCCLPSRAVIPFFLFSFILIFIVICCSSSTQVTCPHTYPTYITAMCVLNTKISEAGYNLKPCQIGKRYRHQPTGLSNLGPSW